MATTLPRPTSKEALAQRLRDLDLMLVWIKKKGKLKSQARASLGLDLLRLAGLPTDSSPKKTLTVLQGLRDEALEQHTALVAKEHEEWKKEKGL
ncbi:MAG: hypothetical protein ACYC3G_00725 [Minisyncoccota bacterium]